MRMLKREDPSNLGLGLELELQSEDVDAAFAAVAAASQGQIPCSCCDEVFCDTEQLHTHQMEHHSLSELSLALISLRGLDLPLMNETLQVKDEVCNEKDDSCFLRSILLETVNHPHGYGSESTLTLDSDALMPLNSEPSSPVLSTSHQSAIPHWDLQYSPQVENCASVSPTLDSYDSKGKLSQDTLDSGFWDVKSTSQKKGAAGRKKSKKTTNDLDSRQFFCGQCDRSYKKKSHLKRHGRTHTGVRPYACPHCEKCFAVRSILKQHIRVHTGERPFSCNICFQRFPQKSGLMTHMMLHNGKPFKCEYCVKSFVSNHKLMIHQRSHGDLVNGSPNQGPYSCSSCKMRFFTSGALAEHTKVHDLQSPIVPSSKSRKKRNTCHEDVTISEEAARMAVGAISHRSDDSPENEMYIPQVSNEFPYFDDSIPDFHEDFLDTIKSEIFIDEGDDRNESFFCEGRWSGIDDIYLQPECNDVY